jgi:hypothetical protein
MSKPNLLAFSSSVGIYRNKRMRDLRRLLSKSIQLKVEFADMAPMLFQVVMAYAAENQIDGNFGGYSADNWCEIFSTNNVRVTPAQATTIVNAFREVGLFDCDKIRSWMKYNRHLGDYEGIIRAKRKAAKIMHKKRELEARGGLKAGHAEPSQNGSNSAPKPVQNGPPKPQPKGDSPSKQLWLLNQAIESAPSRKAKAALQRQKAQLLAGLTGVDLDAPAAVQAKQAEAIGMKPSDWTGAALELAKAVLKDVPDTLTETMVEALLKAGHNPKTFPDQVQRRFSRTIERLHNPVPE